MVVASTAAAACGAWLYHLDSWYEEAKHERASYEWCVGRCACEGRRVGGWEEAVVDWWWGRLRLTIVLLTLRTQALRSGGDCRVAENGARELLLMELSMASVAGCKPAHTTRT
jgi:hypothetical protein